MTNLSVRVPKRPLSPAPDITKAYTPRGQTELIVHIGSPVGKGVYGQVFSASVDRQRDSVLKRSLLSGLSSPEVNGSRESLRHEKETFEALPPHPNIIGYRAATPKGSLLLEKAPQTLESAALLARVQPTGVKEEFTLNIVYDMLKALLHLKINHFTHNDAHHGNWMLGEDGKFKLIDFGMTSKNNKEGLSDFNVYQNMPAGEGFYYRNHPVTAINRLTRFIQSDHLDRIKTVSGELKKILLHDLNSAVLKNYEDYRSHYPSSPERPNEDFYKIQVSDFLTVTNEAGSAYVRIEEHKDLLKDLLAAKDTILNPRETVDILEHLLNDPIIFPQQHPN